MNNLNIASKALVHACMSESLSSIKFGLSLPLAHQVRFEHWLEWDGISSTTVLPL